MKDIVDAAYARAIDYNADGATGPFYQFLREGRFCSTRCPACGHIPFPPRLFCPACGSQKVEWVDLPGECELYAFTQQERSLRFIKPDVLGLVMIAGVGLVLTSIDAPFEALRIGQRVTVEFQEISPG